MTGKRYLIIQAYYKWFNDHWSHRYIKYILSQDGKTLKNTKVLVFKLQLQCTINTQ